MKIKTDFTTNSSSSSFTIQRGVLSEKQELAIINHSQLGKMLGIEYSEYSWKIDINGDFISADTIMNNFDMGEFLDKIGVERSLVEWSEYERSYESYVPAKIVSEWESLLVVILSV